MENKNELEENVKKTKHIEVKNQEELEEKEKDIKKIKTRQFFSLPVEVLEKNSTQACICYMYLLYKSNLGKIISNTRLAKEMNCSTRTITRLLEELENNECITVIMLNKTYRLIYPTYIIPIIYKNNDTEEKKEKQIEEKETYGKYKKVKLTKEEYNDLLKEIKKDKLDRLIEKVDEYLALKDNKQYKNHYLLLKRAYNEEWYNLEDENGGFEVLI